jgi:hypothetical protein
VEYISQKFLGIVSDMNEDGINGLISQTGNDMADNGTYWSTTTVNDYLQHTSSFISKTIKSYAFITENGYTPNSWKVQGSSDGISWIDLHSVSVSWTWDTGKNKVEYNIPLENRRSFKYHRVLFDSFSVSEVRIYMLQFYNVELENKNQVRILASPEDPIILSFADGFEEDGITPIDHEVTINTNNIIDIIPTKIEHSPQYGANKYRLLVYAEYDPISGEVIFDAEHMNVDDYINIAYIWRDLRDHFRWTVVSDYSDFYKFLDEAYSSSAIWFDSNYLNMICSHGTSFYCSYIYFRYQNYTSDYSDYDPKIYTTQNYGETWDLIFTHHVNDRVTREFNISVEENITGLRLKDGYYIYNFYPYCYGIYENGFGGRKFSNGKVLYYDTPTDQWIQKYRIFLGTIEVIKSADGNNWEVSEFLPFQNSRNTIVPFPKHTFKARW